MTMTIWDNDDRATNYGYDYDSGYDNYDDNYKGLCNCTFFFHLFFILYWLYTSYNGYNHCYFVYNNNYDGY